MKRHDEFGRVQTIPPIIRFYRKVNSHGHNPGVCWEWRGAINTDRKYGRFWLGGKMILAHQASYLLHHGPVPQGKILTFRCGNVRCVNPYHLCTTTRSARLAQSYADGKSTNTKLKPAEALAIFLSSEPLHVVAARYNVHWRTAHAIRRGETWRWVTGAAA